MRSEEKRFLPEGKFFGRNLISAEARGHSAIITVSRGKPLEHLQVVISEVKEKEMRSHARYSVR